jgi:hypothetical protein
MVPDQRGGVQGSWREPIPDLFPVGIGQEESFGGWTMDVGKNSGGGG